MLNKISGNAAHEATGQASTTTADDNQVYLLLLCEAAQRLSWGASQNLERHGN